jgi:hypothetical protein
LFKRVARGMFLRSSRVKDLRVHDNNQTVEVGHNHISSRGATQTFQNWVEALQHGYTPSRLHAFTAQSTQMSFVPLLNSYLSACTYNNPHKYIQGPSPFQKAQLFVPEIPASSFTSPSINKGRSVSLFNPLCSPGQDKPVRRESKGERERKDRER